MACVKYLALCNPPPLSLREGQVGAFAYINIIGVGPWYASGQLFDFPNAALAQDKSRTYNGTVKPDTFNKGFAGIGDAACPS